MCIRQVPKSHILAQWPFYLGYILCSSRHASHCGAIKALVSLHKSADSPEPSLLTYTNINVSDDSR